MKLIATTEDRDFEDADFRLLGHRGAYSWQVLRRALQQLGSEYAELLAEPQVQTGKGRTDWYAHVGADVSHVPASELDPAARAALFDRLEGMRRNILALADRLADPAQRGADTNLAKALRLAVTVPDESLCVCSLANNPLLIAWARRFSEVAAQPGATIVKWVPYVAPKTETVADTPPRTEALRAPHHLPWATLLWLAFAGLVGSIYYLLLPACGVVVAPEDSWFARLLPAACSLSSLADPLADEGARRELLERQIQEAELNLARIQGACAPPLQPAHPVQRAEAPPAEAPRTETPKENPDFVERLEREHAKTGPMRISLKWNGAEDLDLHVKCPGGELWFVQKTVCDGKLDVDMNNEKMDVNAVENAVWESPPPAGGYTIEVVLYGRRGEPKRPIPFEVRLKRGESVQEFNGTVTDEGERRIVHSFEVN